MSSVSSCSSWFGLIINEVRQTYGIVNANKSKIKAMMTTLTTLDDSCVELPILRLDCPGLSLAGRVGADSPAGCGRAVPDRSELVPESGRLQFSKFGGSRRVAIRTRGSLARPPVQAARLPSSPKH